MMGGHLGGKPETSADQHHTTEPGADEPDDHLWHTHLDFRTDTIDPEHMRDRGDRDMRLTEDRIVDHAAVQGWPIAACGDPCGFVATAADASAVEQLLDTHVCGHSEAEVPPPVPPGPSLGRLVVGCATFIAILIIIGSIIEDLAGVK